MSEERYTRITITSSRSTTYYTEQEIAEYCQMEVQAIRRLQAATHRLICWMEVVLVRGKR